MKMVWVTFQKKGFHRYPGAPEDVKYLRDVHRHIFKFKVGIEVTHDNRDIEFHQMLNWLESLYEGTLDVDFKSCEMMANDLHEKIVEKYGHVRCFISVAEDGECGAFMTYGFDNGSESHAVIAGASDHT